MNNLGNKEIFSKNLRHYMTLENYSRLDLCKALGFKYTTFTDWYNGNIYPRIDTIEKLANFLRIDKSDLIEDNNKNDNLVKSAVVFIYGVIPAGIPIECIEDVVGFEEINAHMLRGGKQYFGLKIKGDSMSPKYLDGDTIILEKVEDCESGQECVVMVNGNDGTFKKVIKGPSGIMLQPLNPKYDPISFSNEDIEKLPVRIVGKVVELRRKI